MDTVMFRRCTLIVALVLAMAFAARAAPGNAWPNLSQAPTAADRTIVVNHLVQSRDAIAAALANYYRPGNTASPGSTGQTVYKSWLLLWKWSDLLSRTETDEARRFLTHHFYVRPNNSRPTLYNSGAEPPADSTPAPVEFVEKTFSNPRILASPLKNLLPADAPAPQDQPLASLLPPELQREWTADENFLQTLLDTLSPEDYSPQVLRNLVAMRQAQPAQFHNYKSLAIAIAVVYDQKIPNYWPHRQVTPDLVPVKEQPAADWFAYWVKTNESAATYVDLRTLNPEELKFVVDAPVDESEFDWARKNIHHVREDFAKTFSDITYSVYRYNQNALNWTGMDYTLANIKKQGGICVDQAYFGMIAGKARGLPTLFFTGQGTNGGHAWFGYLKGLDRWELDCGRYVNQNFVIGKALDPQTWREISDHQLTYLTERFHSRPEYAASRDDVVLAGILEAQGNAAQAAKAYDSAIAVCARNTDAWDAKAAYLTRTGASVEALRALHQSAIQQFSSLPDVKAAHQSALAALELAHGDTAQANSLTHQIADQNQAGRTDIVITTEAQKISTFIKARNWPAALREHTDQLNAMGRKAGSSFFNKITEPLVLALSAAGESALADEALQSARASLQPDPDSSLDKAMRSLEAAVDSPDAPKKNAAGAKPLTK